jgi:hypothetical protein
VAVGGVQRRLGRLLHPGDDHHRHAAERLLRAQRPQEGVAAHRVHQQVEQDRIRQGPALQLVDGLDPVRGQADVVPLEAEEGRQRLAQVVVVLDHEDAPGIRVQCSPWQECHLYRTSGSGGILLPAEYDGSPMRAAACAIALLAGATSAPPPAAPAAERAPWERLEPGLDLGVFAGPPAPVGDRKIHVLRIDPTHFELKLLNASAPGEGSLRTAREWSARAGAVAAINAGMFMADYRTSVSLMRRPGHVNNPRVTRDKAVLAFDRTAAGVPPVQLIDRECQDLDALMPAYRSFVQSIRLVSCERKNVWAASDKRWSTAALGVDGAGRVLLVHARTAWPVHELVDALLALPIDLQRAMYLEGGPEAQLYVKAGGRELELSGALHGAVGAAWADAQSWPVPNVIAAVRR